MLAVKCAVNAPPLEWNGKIFGGDSNDQGIYRQNGVDDKGQPVFEYIKCSDEIFNHYRCISDVDYRDLAEKEDLRLLKCEKWSAK